MEYFGDGVKTLSCTGMATICNMGAEIGAYLDFPIPSPQEVLIDTHRAPIAEAADSVNSIQILQADEGAEYDKVIEINLSELEPHVNGPFLQICLLNFQIWWNRPKGRLA